MIESIKNFKNNTEMHILIIMIYLVILPILIKYQLVYFLFIGIIIWAVNNVDKIKSTILPALTEQMQNNGIL